MASISIGDIERDVLGFLRRVEAGETLVVTQADQPLAEIRPLSTRHVTARPFGLAAGEFTVPDDFDDPLPEEILRQFEGK